MILSGYSITAVAGWAGQQDQAKFYAGKPEYKNEGMIYVWLGAFIPCIVFPFFRELAYSLTLLHSPDVSIRPFLPMLLE